MANLPRLEISSFATLVNSSTIPSPSFGLLSGMVIPLIVSLQITRLCVIAFGFLAFWCRAALKL